MLECSYAEDQMQIVRLIFLLLTVSYLILGQKAGIFQNYLGVASGVAFLVMLIMEIRLKKIEKAQNPFGATWIPESLIAAAVSGMLEQQQSCQLPKNEN